MDVLDPELSQCLCHPAIGGPLVLEVLEVLFGHLAPPSDEVDPDSWLVLHKLAFKKNLADPFPKKELLEYILTEGGKLTLGDDSHHPDQVGLNFDRLFDYLQALGVSTIHTLEKSKTGQIVDVPIPLVKLPPHIPQS